MEPLFHGKESQKQSWLDFDPIKNPLQNKIHQFDFHFEFNNLETHCCSLNINLQIVKNINVERHFVFIFGMVNHIIHAYIIMKKTCYIKYLFISKKVDQIFFSYFAYVNLKICPNKIVYIIKKKILCTQGFQLF